MKFFRKIDSIGIFFMIFVWVKFKGYLGDPASCLFVVIFLRSLEDYINDEKVKYGKKRIGEFWVIVWFYYALTLCLLEVKYPQKYFLPVSELGFILWFVLCGYLNSKKEGEEGGRVFILVPQYFLARKDFMLLF